jgi:hypothetical protein
MWTKVPLSSGAALSWLVSCLSSGPSPTPFKEFPKAPGVKQNPSAWLPRPWLSVPCHFIGWPHATPPWLFGQPALPSSPFNMPHLLPVFELCWPSVWNILSSGHSTVLFHHSGLSWNITSIHQLSLTTPLKKPASPPLSSLFPTTICSFHLLVYLFIICPTSRSKLHEGGSCVGFHAHAGMPCLKHGRCSRNIH